VASDIDIQKNVVDDVIAQLVAQGVSDPVYREGTQQDPIYPSVAVNVLNENDELPAETGISGFHRLDIEIDAQTYSPVDGDTTAAQALLGDCRGAFSWDDILAQMNALSAFNTYLYLATSNSDQYTEDRVNHRKLAIQILMRPSNEK